MPELSALGFISMQFMRNTGELLATHRKLDACATARGYRLKKVYVQNLGPADAVFDLVGALIAPTEVHGVAVWKLSGEPFCAIGHLHRAVEASGLRIR